MNGQASETELVPGLSAKVYPNRTRRARPVGAPGRPRPARRKTSGQTLPVGAALVAASWRSRPADAGSRGPGRARTRQAARSGMRGRYPLGAGAGPADGAAVLRCWRALASPGAAGQTAQCMPAASGVPRSGHELPRGTGGNPGNAAGAIPTHEFSARSQGALGQPGVRAIRAHSRCLLSGHRADRRRP